METKITIIYHSGYGHTEKVALAVAEGAKKAAGSHVTCINVTNLQDSDWDVLDGSDAIIFGAPTYMGGVSAKFKEFIDSASKKWFTQSWKNKIAAGFTNSGSYSGDKLNSLFQLAINAAQHSMIWVGADIMPPNVKGLEGPNSEQLNRVGSYLGLATQSNNESPEIAPPHGDIETAKLFGERVATITAQMVRGKRS